MITVEEFENYITRLGHRPACGVICVPKINGLIEAGYKNFKLYVNVHNLCWHINDDFINYHIEYDPNIFDEVLILNERDFKLNSIGIF